MGILFLNSPTKPLTPKQVKMKIKEEQRWKETEQQFKQYLINNYLNPSSEDEEYEFFEDFLVSHNL